MRDREDFAMKRLPLTTPLYILLEKQFTEWLETLGYASQSVYQMPVAIRELLHYLEKRNAKTLHDITAQTIKAYYHDHLKRRRNVTTNEGGLSAEHLNKHLQAIKKFVEYLRQSKKLSIGAINIRTEKVTTEKLTVLTEDEIESLFAATEEQQKRKKQSKSEDIYEAIAERDRAMLAIFYSCGLRRNEGVHLDIEDVNLDSELLHVRKGKNYKERFVPISIRAREYLEAYITNGRITLLNTKKTDALFISASNGTRIGGQMMLLKLRELIQRTGNSTLQQKEVGLHTLRHSIATHLLQHGMKLEKIKEFLGHSSLESTQIYTHLITEEYEQDIYRLSQTKRV